MREMSDDHALTNFPGKVNRQNSLKHRSSWEDLYLVTALFFGLKLLKSVIFLRK